MSPNLYDLLDVDETADATEIRAAWKAAIADLEPSDRRFRAYNDAAGVLLDEQRRSAYDEELATARAADEATHEPAAEPAAEVAAPEQPTEVAEAEHSAPVVLTEVPADEADDADEADGADEPDEPDEVVETAAEPTRTDAGPALWLLALVGVLALLAVAAAAWAVAKPDARSADDRRAALDKTDGQVEQLVADKVVPALSYDYRTLDADLADLQQYMTPAMAQKQAKTWGALAPQIKKQHVVVESRVPGDSPATGLTRVSDDGDRAVVVAFIDQDVRKLATAPFVLDVAATFVLQKDAKTGAWLVDNICLDQACS